MTGYVDNAVVADDKSAHPTTVLTAD
jgi:hypothetical protein